jgi:hypothetical protein
VNTTARALAGLTIASAAVTVALAAPANAMPVPEPSPSPAPAPAPVNVSPAGHGVHRHWPAGHPAHSASTSTGSQTVASTQTSDGSGVDWAQVGYGAIGGIALTTAAGATLIVVRRRQHLPNHG